MGNEDSLFRSSLKEAVESTLAADADAKVLLLSCIDYRYPKRVFETMDELGHRGRYYHLAMAGASHAGNPAKHDGVWHRTLFDHLAFAVDEAKVGGVVVLDHLDCKAFHLYEGVPVGDLAAERAKHVEVATGVVAEVVTRYPKLKCKVTVLLLPKETKPEQIARG
jgi:carbonic anhydrase